MREDLSFWKTGLSFLPCSSSCSSWFCHSLNTFGHLLTFLLDALWLDYRIIILALLPIALETFDCIYIIFLFFFGSVAGAFFQLVLSSSQNSYLWLLCCRLELANVLDDNVSVHFIITLECAECLEFTISVEFRNKVWTVPRTSTGFWAVSTPAVCLMN